MRDRRCRRPKYDNLNSPRRGSLLTCCCLVLIVAGPSCGLPFDEFLAGDEKPHHFSSRSSQHEDHQRPQQSDFFGSFGHEGVYPGPAPSEPSKEEGVQAAADASIPSPGQRGQDGGEHFEAPDQVPFQGSEGEDGTPDWEVLSQHNPYSVS